MDIKNFLQSSYQKEKFIEFIFDKFYGFEENDTNYETPQSDTESKNIQKYKFLGQVELDDGKEIGFFEFQSTSKVDIENNRVSLNTILKKKVEDELLDGAIAIFYNPSNPDVWRLSFIRFSYDEDNKQQVSNLKRYTYVLGRDIAVNTAYTQLKELKYPLINELQEAFGVEKVSKEFFKQYKELYFEVCEYLKPQISYFGSEAKLSFFTKKLLGRIVFLYFLEKKGWLGSDDNWKNGDKQFLTKCFNNECDKYIEYDNYYTDILQPIFFEALNEKRENDYFPKLKCKMPFLNGGLFSKDEFDKLDIIIENNLFEHIFEVFDSYNFTIIEDSPNDSEIAIDPEMLGRVFEDLLEDRKDKGAYYTPREIVHYMCQKSIVNYLLNYFEDNKAIEELVFKQKTDSDYIRKNAKSIEEKLNNIKVLDPAIGSGAFPMGMLHEIVAVLSNLNKTTNIADLKRKVIEKSIYGIDIEQSAVEIAKLRFWLSIVVDEEKPLPLPNLFYKIMVGNSLLETINGFDPLEKSTNSLFDTNETLIDEIQLLLHQFYNAHTNNEKINLQNEIENKIDDILNKKLDKHKEELRSQLNNITLLGFDKKQTDTIQKLNEDISLTESIKKRPTTELFFYKLYFAEVLNNGGFDIIIGNPPYIKEYTNKSAFNRTHNLECYQGKMDIWYLFACKGIDLLKEKGILSFIATNNWVNNAGAKKLKNKVLKTTVIKEYIDFGDYKVFETAGIQTMIMFLQKKQPPSKYECPYSKIINKNINKNELLDFLNKKSNNKFSSFTSLIDSIKLLNNNITFLESKIELILNKIENQKNFTLTDKEVAQGIVGAPDKAFIIQEDEYDNFSSNERSYLKKFHTNAGKYIHNETSKYIFYLTKKNISDIENMPNFTQKISPFLEQLRNRREVKKGLLKYFHLQWPRNEIFFKKGTKIICSTRTAHPSCTYTEEEFYGSRALNFIKTERINLKYLTCILNSKIAHFWLKYKGKLTGDLLQIDKSQLLSIPIKTIEYTKPFEALVDYIIFLNTQDLKSLGIKYELMPIYFEKVIDAMVYELYFEDLLKENNRTVIQYLPELPEIDSLNNDKEKLNIIWDIFTQINDKNHIIATNIFYLDSIPEIKTIESRI